MSAVTINIPFVAALQSDGNALLETVRAATYAFGVSADVVLIGDLTSDIINAFLISHEDSSNELVSLDVTMQNSAAFRDALAAAMQAAYIFTADPAIHPKYSGATEVQGAGSAVGFTLQQYVKAAIHTDVITALASNTIASELEASDVQDISLGNFAGDCSGAAAAMWTGLDGLDAGLRRVVATQVPNSKYTAAGEGFTSAIPLVAGDTMVFRFNLNSNLTIAGSPQDLTSGTGVTDGTGPGVGSYTDGTTLASATRIVELRLSVPA
jgi:hypothetical protein